MPDYVNILQTTTTGFTPYFTSGYVFSTGAIANGGAWYDDVEEITRFAGPTSLVTEFVTPTMTGETALLILAKCPFLSQYSYEIIEEWLDKEPSTRCDELITAVTYGINALIDAGKFPEGIPKVTCALSDNGQFYDTIDPS